MKIEINPTIKHASLVFFSAILLMSCDKDKDAEDKEGPKSSTKTVVYAAGVGNGGDNLVGVRYWKDGEIVPVTDHTNELMVEGIYASNGDVYVVGSERSSGSYVATYWKNGLPFELTDGSSSAFGEAIFVDRGDVYVSGVEFESILSTSVRQAKYWKNGVVHNLSEKKAHHGAQTRAIAIDGDDVYIAGFERNGNFDVAKYWKNGEPFELTEGISSNADATGIAVINGNVHVSGHEFIDGIVVPTYWLNGVPTRLSDPGVGFWTNGMAVSGGGDVYIIVRENGALAHVPDKVGYWKVGQPIVALTNGVNYASVYGIAADGEDVYIVGDYRFDGEPRSACIWKNGEISELPSGGSNYSEAVSVFLAKEPI